MTPPAQALLESATDFTSFFQPETLDLHLRVDDPHVVGVLCSFDDERQRERQALAALRIGVLALEQARGRIDADAVHREADHLLTSLGEKLADHARSVNERFADALKGYFDPQNGRFEERMRGLLREDGDLQRVLRSAVSGDDSALARTLAAHVGTTSPLMRILDPNAANGLIGSLSEVIEQQLANQRKVVLSEFSLDNSEGALRRLLDELQTRHGKLEESMARRIEDVVGEFSLDDDDSALSRLLGRLEVAQSTITNELTLDREESALARMAKMLRETRDAVHDQLTLDDAESPMSKLLQQLSGILQAHGDAQARFRTEVVEQLARLETRRDADSRSTEHGRTFEEQLLSEFQRRAIREGDVCEATGAKAGLIRNNKKGDATICVGPEGVAAGSIIAIEAKEDKTYSAAKALAEMEEARKNRGAAFGIFIFSKKTAPECIPPLKRVGKDVLAVWDAGDPSTDLVLDAALTIAKALCVIETRKSAEQSEDLGALEKAVLEVEKRVGNLDQVATYAQTIQTNSTKILDRVRIDREALERQVEILHQVVASLKRGPEGE